MPHRRAGRKPRPKRARRALPDQRIIREALEVPPEIWALVVAFGGRQATGRLCAVSRRFYFIFTPLLYGATVAWPLTDSQSAALLIRTLSEAHKSALTPNPASLIQALSVPRDYRPIDARQELVAVRNLVKLSRGDERMRGSALRALEWNYPARAGELAIFLRASGNFPHLKEISVKYEGEPACLDLIQIPNLEKIGCHLQLSPAIRERAANFGMTQNEPGGKYDAWPRSWNALGDALKRLPTSSPRLQALNLKLDMSQWDTSPSWEGFGDLVKTMNQIRFPALTSVKLAVDVRNCDHGKPAADFAPLLFAHTSLASVTLDVERTRIPTDVHRAQLPRLRSFTGSVQQCAAISACAPELEELCFVFPFDSYRDPDDITNSPRFIPSLFPPNIGPTVKHLNVRAVSEWNGLTYGCELSPHALTCLAMAFPNITHLDVYLNPQTNKPRDGFSGFLALEYLCIRERKNMAVSHRRKPAKTFFSRKKYAAQLSTALPSLPRLLDVEFVLLVDRFVDPDSLGCPCCDKDWNEPWLPNSVVEYRFGVDRTGGEAELVLVGQSVS